MRSGQKHLWIVVCKAMLKIVTMKTLMLLRHAKATQDIPVSNDRDRPLLPRGVRDAKKLGKYLNSKKDQVNLIISSPAVRALQTAQIVRKALGIKNQLLREDENLYLSDCLTLLKVIQETGDDIHTLMLVGHNPELDEVTSFFMKKYHHLRTCSMIILTFDTQSWADIQDIRPEKISLID